MKKILIIVLILSSFSITAQERKRDVKMSERPERIHDLKDFSVEEIATIKSKKMALQLDLDASQQAKIKALLLEQSKHRKNRMEQRQMQMEKTKNEKISKEERFKMLNNGLDEKIDMRNKIKEILTKDQFEKLMETDRMMDKKKSMTRMPRKKNQTPNN